MTHLSRQLATLTATLLTGTLLTVGGAPASAAPGGASSPATSAPALRATPEPVRIGSYNIQARRDLDTFKRAVTEFKPLVDVAGLQEIAGHIRNNWLMEDTDWRIYRGPTVGQVSVIWRPEVLEFIDGREVKLSDAALIEGDGGALEQKKADYAPVVRLRHVPTGKRISVMSVHLLSGTINRGRPDPARPRAVKVYKEQVARLRQVVRAEMDAGYRPYVTGDFNIGFEADREVQHRKFPYRQLGRKGLGLTSMWEGQKLRAHGTHIDTECPPGVKQCGAYLDGIWARGKPETATVATDLKHSDHYPVVGTYSLPRKDLYVPPVGTVGFQDVATSFAERDRPFQVREPVRFRLTGDLAHGFVKVEVVGVTATEGEDFTVDDSSLFDNDVENNHVDVYLLPDQDRELHETFVLRLVDPVNTVVTVPLATGTILDDD